MLADITALLPAHNERLRCSVIFLRTPKYTDCAVVIDDCSIDRTAEIADLDGAAPKTGFEAQETAESPTSFTKESSNTVDGLNEIIIACVWRRCI